MSKVNMVAGVGLVVALVGGVVAFLSIRSSQQREAEIESLLRDARVELAREEIDRDAADQVINKLRDDREGATEPRLLRARTRLEMALGRPQRAWDVLATLALEPEPSPRDMELAATILARLHAQIGKRELALEAMSFAERHYDATGEVASLFLAWQCARRAGQETEQQRLAQRLQESHPETPAARLVALLGSDKPDLAALRKIEFEFDPVPEELDLLLAVAALQEAKPDGEIPAEVLERVERVLHSYPADSDTRNVAAVAYHRLGDRQRRDLQLKWLLANAPPDDNRRKMWRALLQQ